MLLPQANQRGEKRTKALIVTNSISDSKDRQDGSYQDAETLGGRLEVRLRDDSYGASRNQQGTGINEFVMS